MNAATTAPLLFNWDAPGGRNFALIGFLTASLAAHVACFYLFQIVYPPTVSLMPAPQRVNLISPNSEQGVTLLSWVDAEDPALAFTTRRPSDSKRYLLGKVQHVPSYFATEPALKDAPPLIVDLRIPSAQPPGPVPTNFRPTVQPAGPTLTKISFSDELNQLGQPTFPTANFSSTTNEPPQNIQFRIAVDAGGAVRYCFILSSSGDAALDEQARQHLALCRFSTRLVLSGAEGPTSDSASLVWGIATIEWGNDVAAANAKSTSKAP